MKEKNCEKENNKNGENENNDSNNKNCKNDEIHYMGVGVSFILVYDRIINLSIAVVSSL